MELKNRNEIDEKYKFDLTKWCAGTNEFYERLEKVRKQVSNFDFYKGKLGNPDTLFEYNKYYESVYNELEILDGYAHALFDVDSLNNEYVKMNSALEKVEIEFGIKTSFCDEELRNLGEKYLQTIVENPKFAEYKLSVEKFIENLHHTLSEHDEHILSEMSSFSNFASNFSTFLDGEMHIDKVADCGGNLHEMRISTYSSFLRKEDRVLRKNAFFSLSNAMKNSKNTLFAFITNSMKRADFVNRLGKYDSVLESELNENDLPQEVFDKVLSKARQYAYLKKEYQIATKNILGLDDLMPWDMGLPLTKYDPEVTFEDAKGKLAEALKCLGSTYTEALERAFEERWCDIYPSKGKTSSVYCVNIYGKTPIMHFNWENNADDVLTFAHEFGHSVQALITNNKQPYSLASMPWCLVEIPSLTVETITYLYLLNNAHSDEEKLLHMQNYIKTLRANIFSGSMDAELERYMRDNLREGKVLDVETVSDFVQNFDKENSILPKIDDAKYNWMSDGHIFYPYYNYNYTLDMLVACYFAQKIYSGDKKVLNDFVTLMENGSSKKTLDLLNESGIDLLDDKVYDEAFAFFENTLNDFVALSEKIKKDNEAN